MKKIFPGLLLVLFSLFVNLSAQETVMTPEGILYPGDYTGVEWLIDIPDQESLVKSWWEDSRSTSQNYALEDSEVEDEESILDDEESILDDEESILDDEESAAIAEETQTPEESTDNSTKEPVSEPQKDELKEFLSHQGITLDSFTDYYLYYSSYKNAAWENYYKELLDLEYGEIFNQGAKITKEEALEVEKQADPLNKNNSLLDTAKAVTASYITGSNVYKKFLSPEIKPTAKKSLFEDGDKIKAFSSYTNIQSVTLNDSIYLNDKDESTKLYGVVAVVHYENQEGQEETEISIFWFKKTDKGYRLIKVLNGMKEFLFFAMQASQS